MKNKNRKIPGTHGKSDRTIIKYKEQNLVNS